MEKYNPKESLQKMNTKELQEQLGVMYDRYILLVEMGMMSLFRYDVKSDIMYLWTPSSEGGVSFLLFRNFLETCPSFMFDESCRHEIPQILRKIINDADFPKRGNFQFKEKDGHSIVEAEYTTSFGENGNATSISGQLVDINRTPKVLQKTIESLNDYISTNEALQSAYETVLFVNLRDYSFVVKKATPEVTAAASQVKNVIELARLFCEYNVDDNYKETLYEFFDPKTVYQRMVGQKVIVCDYLTKNIGWRHARLVPVEYDEDGNVTQIVFTTEATTDRTSQLGILRVAAERDGLTGLINRSKGESLINDLLAAKTPAVFALFDCDRFKYINDTHGHPVGDIVLCEIAKAFKEVFPNDKVIRLGGDEFVVFITSFTELSVSDLDVDNLFAPLKKRIADIRIPQLMGRKLTLSGGVSLYSGLFGSSFEKLYHKADIALYESKKSRNGTITVN